VYNGVSYLDIRIFFNLARRAAVPESKRENWFVWTVGSIAVGCVFILLSPLLITKDLERRASQGCKSTDKEVEK
jgi:hypothetical protein